MKHTYNNAVAMWLDFGKWTDQIVALGLFHFIDPANGYTSLYTTHSYTVPLPGLVDWSAFIERILLTL